MFSVVIYWVNEGEIHNVPGPSEQTKLLIDT